MDHGGYIMKNIEVYTINNCGYCDAAKSLLTSLNLAFKEFNISHDDNMRMELVKKTNHRTMPQIFIDGEFIGGYTELKEHLNNLNSNKIGFE